MPWGITYRQTECPPGCASITRHRHSCDDGKCGRDGAALIHTDTAMNEVEYQLHTDRMISIEQRFRIEDLLDRELHRELHSCRGVLPDRVARPEGGCHRQSESSTEQA